MIPALCSCTCLTTKVVTSMLNPQFFCVGVQMVMMFCKHPLPVTKTIKAMQVSAPNKL